jgi:parallel beta-helix repeat protein
MDMQSQENSSFDSNDIARMRDIAAAHQRGDLECDAQATFTITSGKKRRRIAGNDIFARIFGEEVDLADVHRLLQARADEVGCDGGAAVAIGDALALTCLAFLRMAGAPESCPSIRMLADDPVREVAEAAKRSLAAIQAASGVPVEVEEAAPRRDPRGGSAISGRTHAVDTVDPHEEVEPRGQARRIVIEVGQGGDLPTLTQARAAVRERIRSGCKGEITVLVGEGTYREAAPLCFGPEDGGNPWLKVTWKAQPGKTVVISGSTMTGEWKRVDWPVDGMPPVAQGMLWAAKVAGNEPLTVLYDHDRVLPRAASGPLHAAGSLELSHNSVFVREADRLDLACPADAELVWRKTYFMNYLPVEGTRPATGEIRLSQPATYPFIYSVPGELWLENAMEFLDRPGRWVFNSSEGIVYLWPDSADGTPGDGIHYAACKDVVAVSGNIERREYVRNLVFDGLTIQHGRRMSWHGGRTGLMSDWDVFDEGWAGFHLRGAHGCEIRNCVIAESGGNGVKLGVHCVGNKVCNNLIRDVGGNGISIVGYGPGKQDETHHNEIARNHIHNVGAFWDGSVGILVCQSGNNRITNNLIHDLKYSGIVLMGGRSGIFYKRDAAADFDGVGYTRWEQIPEAVEEGQWWHQIGFVHTRDNLVDYNDISRVMLEREDGNAIYLSGVGTGNIVERNHLHDMGDDTKLCSAVRFDDTGWYNTARFNVLENVKTGFVLKCVNRIENNIIYGYTVRSFRIATTNQVNTPSYGAGVVRNIVVARRLELAAALCMQTTHQDRNATIMEEPTLDDNLYHVEGSPGAAERQLRLFQRLHGHDRQSLAADPCFRDPARGDFTLRPGSPARKLGIQSIERYGLQAPAGPVGPEGRPAAAAANKGSD